MTDPVAPKPPKVSADDLAPPDWPAIEPHYKAGVRSRNGISQDFGVSRAAIEKHARKHGWVYGSLAPEIHSAADRLVAQTAVAGQIPKRPGTNPVPVESGAKPLFTDSEVVEAGAQQLALVKLEHRKDIANLRSLIRALADELGEVTQMPDLAWRIHDALSHPDEPPTLLRELAEFVKSIPARVKVAKDLADAMHKCIGMEREAFGLDTKGGTDGVPTVLIRDYTGKGDADAPQRKPNQYADE